MKKAAYIFLIAFAAAIVFSSCNRETCPAYSQADTEQTGHIG